MKNNNVLKKLLNIAVPIMLSNLISQLQMLIDRIFLGQMDTMYMAALGNVNSPIWTTMSFCFSITIGASILISQSVGAKNPEKVEICAASLIKWNNVIPVLLFFFWMFCGEYVFRALGAADNLMPMCLEYTRYFAPIFLIVGLESSFSVIMQTSNHTQPMVWFGVIRAGLNIILDWIMIFGKFGCPQMGIKGAAIATTIAEYAGCLFAFGIVLKSKKLTTRPSLRSVLGSSPRPFLSSIVLGINSALEDFAWNIGNLVLIRILNSIDKMAAGIYSIVFTVEVVVVVVIGAIGNGTLTISGEAKGRGDLEQYRVVCKCAYILSAAISFVMLIVCAAFPQDILALFTKDESIITSCGIYLILVCLNLYGKSGNIIVGSSIRGSGNTLWMLTTQIFGTFLVIGSAAFFVYVLKLGIIGVFFAVIVDEGTRALINLAKFITITKKWEKTA